MISITEGETRVRTHVEKVVSKKMPVFYNPEKKFDRDLSIDFLRAVKPKKFIICDLLAATGIRGIRMAKEVGVRKVILNDANPKAYRLIKKNVELNRIRNAEVFNEEANRFLLNNEDYYEYLDIDPFGSPVRFLENGIKKIRKDGFVAITATDSATLVGTYPDKCKRIYGSRNTRTDFMHETGLRILAKKAIEVGVSQEMALIPVFAHRTRHYFRIYFQIKRNRRKLCDMLLEKIGYIWYDRKTMDRGIYRIGEKTDKSIIGPLWLGSMAEKEILGRMKSDFAKKILEEGAIDSPWYFQIHKIAKSAGVAVKKTDFILEKIKERGFNASRTHFDPLGIKTDASMREIRKIIR
jgi:tRNA (guanine26-N2/guanine27-N2)-dimethyltransferase